MSKQQYDLTTKTDYLSRKMFLDPAGPDMDTADVNKLASAKPAVDIEPPAPETPAKMGMMWLHPIELIKGLFSSRKD